MTFPAHIYQPNPSNRLLKHGEIVDNSFYLVEDGILHYGEEKQFPCRFEIAHMKDGNSWVIIYVYPTDELSFKESHKLIDKIDNYDLSVTGQDILMDATITASISYWTYIQHGNLVRDFKHGIRLDCKVRQYKAIRQEDDMQVADFFLVNLPLARWYSIDNVADNAVEEFKEATYQAQIDAVIKETTNIKNKGMADDEWRQHLLSIAKQAQSDFRAENNSPIYSKPISIKANDAEIAHLYHKIDYEERSYDNQPLSRLRIKRESLPDGLSMEETVNWICGLFSLGLGQDINWNYYHVPKNKESEPKHEYFLLHRIWRSKTIHMGVFQAFTEQGGRFDKRQGLDENSCVLKLIDDVFNYVFTLDEKRAWYLYAINNYVNYASHRITDAKHRSALLCLLGEQVYKLWVKVINKPIPPNKSYPIPDRSNGNSGYYNKLMWLFESNGWKVDGYPDELYHLPSRIWKFVKSRNSIFHDHEFDVDYDNEQSDTEVDAEIRNVEAFIPLVFATVLKYKGEYWHPLAWRNSRHGSQWERMPSN